MLQIIRCCNVNRQILNIQKGKHAHPCYVGVQAIYTLATSHHLLLVTAQGVPIPVILMKPSSQHLSMNRRVLVSDLK